MTESVKNSPRAVVEFHHRFGGDNGVVDRPAEVTPEAADCFSKMKKADRKVVLGSIDSIGKAGKSIFDHEILAQLIKELENIPHVDAARAIKQILYYSYNQAPNDLPPFVKISEASNNSSSQKASDLEYIYLLVNRGQLPLPVIITAEMLAGYRHPRVEVDGYVDSMMIVTRSKAYDITVAGNIWRPEYKKYIGIGAGCEKNLVSLSYGDEYPLRQTCFYKDNDGFPQVVLDSLSPSSVKSLEYFLSSDFIDDLWTMFTVKSLSTQSRIPVDIGGYKIEIGHLGLKRLSDLGMGEPKGNVEFFLQGPKKELAVIPSLNKKLTSIYEGIDEAQKMLGVDKIREVRIITHLHKNAWAYREVGFTTREIAECSERQLRIVARHETLHELTELLGLLEDSEIMSYYLDRLGGHKGNPFHMMLDSTPFLKFIAETNFFDDPGVGGHPQSNIREFCVSFTQTLFDFESLVGKFSGLSPNKKAEFLDHYINLTKLFAKTANKKTAKALFYKRYAQLATLRTKWHEHDRSSDAGRHGARRGVEPTRPGEAVYLSSVEELYAKVRAAREKGRRTYVLVYASWCGPCKRFMPRFIEKATKSNDQFLILPVDDVPKGWALADGGIPTVLLYRNSDFTAPKVVPSFAFGVMSSAGLEWYPDIYWP